MREREQILKRATHAAGACRLFASALTCAQAATNCGTKFESRAAHAKWSPWTSNDLAPGIAAASAY